jgi:hypothetical protein
MDIYGSLRRENGRGKFGLTPPKVAVIVSDNSPLGSTAPFVRFLRCSSAAPAVPARIGTRRSLPCIGPRRACPAPPARGRGDHNGRLAPERGRGHQAARSASRAPGLRAARPRPRRSRWATSSGGMLLTVRVIAAEVFPHLVLVSLAPGEHPPWCQRNCRQETQNPAHRYSLLLRGLGVNRPAYHAYHAAGARRR